jgi:hypothetical protein
MFVIICHDVKGMFEKKGGAEGAARLHISKVPLAALKALFFFLLSTIHRVTKIGSVLKMSRRGYFDHCLTIRGNVICMLLFVAIVYTIQFICNIRISENVYTAPPHPVVWRTYFGRGCSPDARQTAW